MLLLLFTITMSCFDESGDVTLSTAVGVVDLFLLLLEVFPIKGAPPKLIYEF